MAAVALGAKVLERHVTLDKTWKGSDHSASLEPGELAELVRSVRLVERALGSPTKQLLPCEMACNEKVSSALSCWAPNESPDQLIWQAEPVPRLAWSVG